jgi:hypothetical protein
MKLAPCLSTGLPRILLLLAATVLSTLSAQAKIHLKISATAQIAESFAKWTAETPLDQITSYKNANANRPTVDLILELQALKAGGLDFDYEIITAPNNARARLEVVQANVDITAETTWDYLIDPEEKNLLRTTPIILDGEFEKGIYVMPTNEKILKVKSLEELQQFTGITVNSWDIDVRTLRAMQLKGLELPSKSENAYAMLAKERADFTLLELSSQPDLSNENNGVRLIPVPGVKIALKGGSRSWIVAKNSPNAEAIHAALVKGVKILRDEGRINRAFKECGFFNPRAADWKRLF